MKNIVIFLNGKLGLKILEYLIERDDTSISAIVINSPEKTKPEYKNQVSRILSDRVKNIELFQFTKDLWEREGFLKHLNSEIFGVSILFGHIFPRAIVDIFNRRLINLHPSLLPIGRGADPIFWSVVEKLPQGASIHVVNEEIDSGEILVQEELPIDSWLTSGEIYELAMKKLYQLFTDFYPGWNVYTQSKPQLGKGTFHRSQELDELRLRITESPGTLFEYLNLIQALTYNDNRRARIVLPNNQIWEVTLQLRQVQG